MEPRMKVRRARKWKRAAYQATALALSCCFYAGVDGSAHATENGATQWPVGVQTVVPAVLPAPGETAFYNYTLYYHADSYKGPNGQDAIPGFDLSVFADAARVVHTWKPKLGQLNMSSGVILAGNNIDLIAGGASDSTFGLNFLYLTPLYLTYNTPTLHLLFGPSVFIPVGQYSVNNLANPTNNYYSFHQELAVTYFPTKTLEISAQGGFTLNGENPDTDYLSGDTFDVDWGVNWAPFSSMPNVFIGLNGFYVQQFTDDEINGATVGPNGNRLQKVALGAQLIYYFSPKAGILAKYQREFDTENGPEGDRYWIQFVTPVGAH